MPMQPSTPTPRGPSHGAVRRPTDDGALDPLIPEDLREADDAMAADDDTVADDAEAMGLGDTGGDQGGEGDYDAARRHRASAERFVAEGRVEEAAHEAEPLSDADARELREAEQRGRDKARG